MIEIEKLQKRFGRLEVLKSLDLSIPRGGIHAVLGPNGSGKTTLIKSILGMVVPDAGSIRIAGEPVVGEWKYRDNISYLPQIAHFPANLTVRELIRMIRDLRARPARDEALIRHFRIEPFLDKRLGHLSGGTRQKVNLVLAFMFEADLVLLDEPTSGLDPVSIVRLRELLAREREAGRTIIVTTHIMSLAEEIADEVIFVLEGRIHFQGTLTEIRNRTGQATLETAIAAILSEHQPSA
ncbi:MAG: ABC transporter ATP-binding protein [Verrucomicrobia bacterium]|nr:MAG: ABC transporter ATP-binding protein [Verrucomicrobiota bacterium]